MFTLKIQKRYAAKALNAFLAAFVFISALFFPSACSKSPIKKQTTALDTFISITLYDGSEQLIDECFQMIRDYEDIFSSKNTSAELYRLNEAGGSEVSAELFDALSQALELSARTGAAFDPTLGALCELWDFRKAVVPTQEQIDTALLSIGYQNIRLTENNRVEYLKDGVKLDLGGFAKGYIADKLSEYLLSRGVDSAILSLGGSVTCIGTKPDGQAFKVAISDPLSTDGGTIETLELKGLSVSTSGSNERYFIADGKRYHHIIDPATGHPAQSGLASVTVISDSAAVADALSTACFVLGLDEGSALIDEMGLDGVFVKDDGEIFDTRMQ